MFRYKYRVSIRIGFNEFHQDFDNEKLALECFESVAHTPDIEIEGDVATVPSDVKVEDVTIRRYPVAADIGNPNRQQ